MALTNFEGFERYQSYTAVKDFINTPFGPSNVAGVVTPTIVSGPIARNQLSCLSMISSRQDSTYNPNNSGVQTRYHKNFYPKVAIPFRDNINEGVIGFAYHYSKPTDGRWGDGVSVFTPFACITDANYRPHFYLCATNNGTVQIRAWNTSSVLDDTLTSVGFSAINDFRSQSICVQYAFQQFGPPICTQFVDEPHNLVTVGSGADSNLSIDPSKFILLGTSSINNPLIQDNWNYIELKYKLDNTSLAENGGFLELKINRSANSVANDLYLNKIRNTYQSINTASNAVFGVVWGHRSDSSPNAGNAANLGWRTLIDDFYSIKSVSGQVDLNNFLGVVSCEKSPYSSFVQNTFASGDLQSISEPFAGSDSFVTPSGNGSLIADDQEQIANFNVNINTNKNIVAIQPVVHAFAPSSLTKLNFSLLFGSLKTPQSGLSISSNSNGGITYGPVYSRDINGNIFTDLTLNNHAIKHEVS
jgi:hypothetical protein